eukprot:Plantae.Rhodophyta-Purpureofilum_apyrenoidigerum.ctg1550.p1 GENE.Plantae.Rhodophyta-Purpureofilum_apyrenoidigerum.ctg1550~~Plantae.Rhodophyta-Purpureofilum_apyrenoidigerum.ctg1550.p1  ORF type:complete len:313 (-),score=54.22 Plantae.Rhodophyta-Purpureofilum_apyrenoidigerum.ctg1550:536-1417(-)
MMVKEGSFTGCDGVELFTQRWDPPENIPLKGVVFLHHGVHVYSNFQFMLMGEERHDQYEGSLVQNINSLGLVVCTHDIRGHGRSAGFRALVEFEKIFQDAETYIDDTIKADDSLKDKPVFIGGSSMGGLICVNLALRRPERYKGLFLISAAFEEQTGVAGPFAKLLELFADQIVYFIPRTELFRIPLPHEEKLKREFLADPLCWKGKILAKSAYEFYKQFRTLNVSNLDVPCISLYGEKDQIVSVQAAQRKFDEFKTSDKEICIIKNAWHDLINSEGREQTLSSIRKWLSQRI